MPDLVSASTRIEAERGQSRIFFVFFLLLFRFDVVNLPKLHAILFLQWRLFGCVCVRVTARAAVK